MTVLTEPVIKNLHTVAFYNLENLFDIYDDEDTNDEDFLPTSKKKWTLKRYKNKLRKLGFAVSNIGKPINGKHPAIVGLAEVENALVLKDLIASKHLKGLNYSFVHYNSPDERGIDVAFLYDNTVFKVTHSETVTVHLKNDFDEVDHTRDVLLVTGLFETEKISFIVNHWPSRRDGEQETEHKRLAVSNTVSKLIATLKENDEASKIIIMGDFNDDPSSNSIKQLVSTNNLYNPMNTLLSKYRGSTNYKFKWNLFDQILLTSNFLETERNSLKFDKAHIFDIDFLKLFNGKYKGNPFRTYVGTKYKGGYSDHFPVYVQLKLD